MKGRLIYHGVPDTMLVPYWGGQHYVKPQERPMEKLNSVIEVSDKTNDEMYFPLGMFRTVFDAMVAVGEFDRSGEPISETGREGEDYEHIALTERKMGWSDHSLDVIEYHRKWRWDEEQDKRIWYTDRIVYHKPEMLNSEVPKGT